MKQNKYTLGLDLGTNSIGWVLIEPGKSSKKHIVDLGVRCFEAGMNINEATGKRDSHALERRMARGRRRNLSRRQMRKETTRKRLAEANLLPLGKPNHKDDTWRGMLDLDPYSLRAKALDEKLERYELGRVFYHLAQRRGFLSNRKAGKSDKEEGVVKEGIKALSAEMEESRARTLGEYFNMLDPHAQRIRTRYTHRQWYLDEFNAIWQAQKMHYGDVLTDELHKKLKKAIFYQRPLKSVEKFIGHCALEKGRRRAPMACLAAQRLRYMQDLCHLRVVSPEYESRPITADEFELLRRELEVSSRLTFSQARKRLGIKRGFKFNLEGGDRKDLKGNTTVAKIMEAIGSRWLNLNSDEQNMMVEDLMSFTSEEALEKRARKFWKMAPEEAEAFSSIDLEEGYSSFSRKAISKILPLLKPGCSIAEAVNEAYPDRGNAAAVDILPPLEDLRNPVVQRTLAETRRLVNAIIAKHGKPARIHIELARDLKMPSKIREEQIRRMRAREKERKDAVARIIKEMDIVEPKRSAIEKVLLAEECGWECPYTGNPFKMSDLLGGQPTVDIEHIIPFSRSFDNSFANKTLCDVHENREVKRNRTPWEAYGSTDKYDDILERVRRFTGAFAKVKLERFSQKEVAAEDAFIEQYSSRQLNDTRYISSKAVEYLGQLYGAEWRKCITCVNGQTTAYFRNAWELNKLLNTENLKNRDDHRHHAIDAMVVALTNQHNITALNTASKYSTDRGDFYEYQPGRFRDMPEPWPGFLKEFSDALGRVIVSHRVSRRTNGQLHKDTVYGFIKSKEHNDELRPVVRTPLASLTEPDIRKKLIVDPVIRAKVEEVLAEKGQPPAKAFADRADHPVIVHPNGQKQVVHKVRVYQSVTPVEISDVPPRHMALGNNHHLAIYAGKNRKGEEVWNCEVVPLLEVKRRVASGKDAVRKTNERSDPLVFSLAIGDTVKMMWQGEEVIAVVQKLCHMPYPDYYFKLHNDARMAKERKGCEIRVQSDMKLRDEARIQKLAVTPLGEIHPAND